MAKRDSRYKRRRLRLQIEVMRDWILMEAGDTDNGYGRDKEFRIRFDDHVSFHANEHTDVTIWIHFHIREAGSATFRGGPRILLKVPTRKVGLR